MDKAVDQIMGWTRTKVYVLILQQYKTHIWGGTEYGNGAILHACGAILSRLDRLQKHFLDEVHLTEEVLLLDYNFAPAFRRRDMVMLAFIHERVVGICHPAIERLLPFVTGPTN